jgi:PAS domain S-box-containing protein
LLAANKELESYIRQLKESQENHSILLNAIDEGFCIIEMIFDEREKPVDYRFLMINASFEKQTGLQNAVGKRMREFAPNHEEHWFEIYGRIALTGEPIRFENRAEQLRRWYDVYAFRFGEPKDLQVAILFNDITGRKQAEETIRLLNLELEKRVEEKTSEVIKKEQQYRFLLQNMREGIQIISYDWRYVFVNNSVVNQSKYSNEELLGHTMMEKYPGIENTEMFKVLQRCMKDRIATVFENEFTFPDGTNEWFELSIQPVPEGVFILSMDITERKKAENNLLKSLKEISDYKYAIDESSIVAFTDQKGIITHVNDNFCKISKYSREELIGRDHRIINSGHHPKEFIRNLWVTIANGEIWRGEIKNRAKDGTVYWVDTTIVPFLKTDGKPFQYLAIRSDITQRKEAEEELLKLNQDLEKRTADLQASNTELERFAYVASHDLQEPLRMVGSFLNLLEEEMDGQLNESSKEYIHFAVDGADRMKTLIQALLQYSRIGTNNEDFSATDLNEVMQFTIRVLEEDIQKTHAIITVNPMPVIIANKTLISQLFKNLIGNSLKYHDGKPPEIEVGFTEEPDKYIFFVKDNGIGIDTKFFDKIFIIFQRLHNRNEYSGTGIGLAICKKIVETHKGKIWLESEPGIGSTFYFSILKTRL